MSEISLTTVKVRNFDKTITTIPATAIITEGVKNWRGMEEAGARRYKKHLRIDLNTVSFCSEKMLKKLVEENLIDHNYLEKPKVTNIELYRHYCTKYLNNHPQTQEQKFLLLVRQLQSDHHGLL